MNIIDTYPKPITIDGLPPLHRKKTTAGTKEKCVFCGRKTYRYIGGKAVCSYCSDTERTDKLGPNWKSKIVRDDEQYA